MSPYANCGQRTARTEDWACQWCGYPLLSRFYKKIPKTYKKLQEERLYRPPVVEETEVFLPQAPVPPPTIQIAKPMPEPGLAAMGGNRNVKN